MIGTPESRGKQGGGSPELERTTFRTSRSLDFFSEKELTAQVGHPTSEWPLVWLKEAMDNSVDACEEAPKKARVAPQVIVSVDAQGITVEDNGPGIPPETVAGVLDFNVRVSSREAYVSPTRGAQGNALKTLIAMPFVLDGQVGRVDIEARGVRHEITVRVDRIRQEPRIDHKTPSGRFRENGTWLRVHWPDSACSLLRNAEHRFLQIAEDFAFLNPHLSLTVDWFGRRVCDIATRSPDWLARKWLPRDPTCPHWYSQEQFDRLVSAYIADDQDKGAERTVRLFVSEFRGLLGSAKQKAVLETTGLTRVNLSALLAGENLDMDVSRKLLAAMKAHTKPVKPASLGLIGEEHVGHSFRSLGCAMESFKYRNVKGYTASGVPSLAEVAFAWNQRVDHRRLITGVNWSPGIINPFRKLGDGPGMSLDTVLERQKVGPAEPVVVLMHLVLPGARYTDRGKSAVVIGDPARQPIGHDEEE
jgi:DNA topoisomerase VI subunit B